MQDKLQKFPLACGALLALGCSTAHAQSSVTLYGIVDAGVEYVNRVQPKGAPAASVVQQNSGNLAGSRWGLKGAEDLGGGYRAIFTLEGGFNVNNGTLGQNGRIFGRKAFVGVSTPYGTLTLGRQQNLLYELMYKYDALTFNPSYSAQSMDSQFVNRADNSVRYGLQLAGVTLAALYSTGYDGTIANGANVPGAPKVGREMSAAVLYDRGPLSAGVTYDQLQGTSIATQSYTEQRALFGVAYEIGPVKALAGVRWLNARNTNVLSPPPAFSPSSLLYWGGVVWRVNVPLSVSASVYHTQFREPSGGPTMGALLVDYALSKRTDVYAEGAYMANTKWSNVGIRGTSGDPVSAGMNQTGVTAGIRHTF
ncbi:Outer membrane porin protein [Paraburkholderia aspalathi]|uniref:porin n=1 Tax=Paraburkholderia aspalathi TaxID=1324617 RepID=UPI001B1A5A02|nr:porin [Paraburkholderia aspalathi]CAE6859535.1 Outer membrane porin protein [Paraburkholderia aspalathi]